MKKLLISLTIILNFFSFAKANDISDFQIEGFSLYESLLNYFSRDKIEEEINSKWSLTYNDIFVQIGVGYATEFPLSKKLKNYDEVTLVLRQNDKNYKIFSIAGKKFCEDKQKCLILLENISKDLKTFFSDEVAIEEYEEKHQGDKTGKSMTYNTRFKMLSSGDFLEVSFYDWSKKMEDEKEWKDNIKVIIHSNEFNDFLKTYY
tara:strand:- start:820 stop:1431 length:612 start_codon:yes stop_codon:yes gene_type:complete